MSSLCVVAMLPQQALLSGCCIHEVYVQEVLHSHHRLGREAKILRSGIRNIGYAEKKAMIDPKLHYFHAYLSLECLLRLLIPAQQTI